MNSNWNQLWNKFRILKKKNKQIKKKNNNKKKTKTQPNANYNIFFFCKTTHTHIHTHITHKRKKKEKNTNTNANTNCTQVVAGMNYAILFVCKDNYYRAVMFEPLPYTHLPPSLTKLEEIVFNKG